MLWPKKIHTRNSVTKKIPAARKFPSPPPPHNISNGPSLNSFIMDPCCFTERDVTSVFRSSWRFWWSWNSSQGQPTVEDYFLYDTVVTRFPVQLILGTYNMAYELEAVLDEYTVLWSAVDQNNVGSPISREIYFAVKTKSDPISGKSSF